jgi:amino-acid N-acetyltransferase
MAKADQEEIETLIRKATVADVKKIQKLVNFYAKKERMLPRSLNELYENIRDFFVSVEGNNIYGCCALHVDWEDLAEIKSLAVESKRCGMGIGKKLLEECLKDAKKLKVRKVFALTYIPEFFEAFGFTIVDKKELPHKIWSECIRCMYFPDCKEIAMVKEI